MDAAFNGLALPRNLATVSGITFAHMSQNEGRADDLEIRI